MSDEGIDIGGFQWDAKSEEIFLEIAWRRVEGWVNEKAQLTTNSSIVLAMDGILVGFALDKVSGSTLSIASMFLLMISASLSLCIFIGRKYVTLGIAESWEALSGLFFRPQELKLKLVSTLAEQERIGPVAKVN